MTVKELRKLLFEMDDDAIIVIGCQGYIQAADEEIRATESNGKVFLTDTCYYEEID